MLPGKKAIAGTLLTTCVIGISTAQQADYPIQPVNFTHVHLTDNFWAPKIRVNADITIPYTLQQCRDHGRVDNFLEAAGILKKDKLTDFPFDDTDIYKVIEGASYAMQSNPNQKLDLYVDTLISYIAAAQEPDGYLYTFRTIKPAKQHSWVGSKRWEKEEDLSHELYNSGHLFEAAVAHYLATGKKTLLDVAIKNADLLVRDFGYGKEEKWPGHQVVEMGLVKLYRVTGKKEYLDLARFFLDIRGPKGSLYGQANKKVVDQHEGVGHAVRATYMYAGMADVSALTGDKKYLAAIDDIWQDVVYSKLYLTGGIGATGNGEAFGAAYHLPNMSAYAETCASIANVYWNSRMFLLHGDAKYIDVLERVLYNGLLSGVSLSGDRFFYPNPLASVGQHQRSAWFSCACCISNMTRFMPSVPGYVYAQNGNNLFVNLFMSNTAEIVLPATKVQVVQQTEYPWKGTVGIIVNPQKTATFSVQVRVPGWAQQQPVPGDLYRFADNQQQPVNITINGKPVAYKLQNGYAVFNRNWKKGDKVVMVLPMEVQKVLSNDKVKEDKGRFALQRGPVVYCLEGPDNKDSVVQNIVVDKATPVNITYKSELLNGIVVLTMQGSSTSKQNNSDVLLKHEQSVTAIPYYAWANRGPSEMEVWIPYEAAAARPKPTTTIASLSKASSSLKDTRMNKALNDQYDPQDSRDDARPYLHWWPKKNSTEWVQYDFDKSYTISESKVYWFDDEPWGGCRIPVSWKLYYKKGEEWIPVTNTTAYEIARNRYNTVKFEPITTTALKLEVQLPVENSSGIHEWIVK